MSLNLKNVLSAPTPSSSEISDHEWFGHRFRTNRASASAGALRFQISKQREWGRMESGLHPARRLVTAAAPVRIQPRPINNRPQVDNPPHFYAHTAAQVIE